MANSLAMQYLSDESLEALESSEGAIFCVHKPEQLETLRKKHEDNMQEYSLRSNYIKDKKKVLEDLKSKTFARLFNINKIKQRIAATEADIIKSEEEISAFLKQTEKVYNEILAIEKEIGRFIKKIRIFGLTTDDIKKEYQQIKSRLKTKPIVNDNNQTKNEVINQPEKIEEKPVLSIQNQPQ